MAHPIRAALICGAVSLLGACSLEVAEKPVQPETPAERVKLACMAFATPKACECLEVGLNAETAPVLNTLTADVLTATSSPTLVSFANKDASYALRKKAEAYYQGVESVCSGDTNPLRKAVTSIEADAETSFIFKRNLTRLKPLLLPKIKPKQDSLIAARAKAEQAGAEKSNTSRRQIKSNDLEQAGRIKAERRAREGAYEIGDDV